MTALTTAGESSVGVAVTCAEPACGATPAEQCGYVDSHASACLSHWCAEHGADIGGLRYCRRHAGVIVALGSKANNPRALPDIGNRGPSLVRWLYRDLDPALTGLLEDVASTNEHILRDTEVTVARDDDGARRWEMSWKVASPRGIRLRIALVVEEADDSVVHVRFQDEVVASGTPPWIEARRRGVVLSEDVDRAQRREFYGFLENFLAEALAA
ncbi:MAG: hypothetical protein ACYDAC_04785 [Candidatus Dormibacteria bacterium]